MSEMRFQNKVVLVTGAASGIGRALITVFVQEGAKGIIVDTDRNRANIVAEQLQARGADVLVSITDVSRADQVDAMMQSVVQKYGRLDALVNCAGVYVHGEVVNLSEQEWDLQVDVQLKGPFLCSRAAARQMIRQGGPGRIINIGSTAAGNARLEAAAHCASKGGVVMLTKVMAMELGKHNITVNCVSPGLTDIGDISEHGPTTEYIKAFTSMVPLGRLASTQEIADVVLFVASEQASFVSGQNIFVDGGYGAGKLSVQGPHTSSVQ